MASVSSKASTQEPVAVEWERKPKTIDANLKDYDAIYKTFDWKDVEQEFDWSRTGKVNIVHEAIDRHAASSRATKVALYYTDYAGRDERYTFEDLKRLTSRFAHALKALGVKKGDRVATFLPRTPELYISILGIHRLGAIPVPLFEAFMEQAVQDRLEDSEAAACVTTPALKGRIPLAQLPALKRLILVGANGALAANEVSYGQITKSAPDWVEPEWLTVDDGLIIHYTSGSTGKSKGALHRQYAMIGHYQTAKWALDLRDDDTYWCVPPSTKVIANPEPKTITDLKVGDRVLAHDGTFCDVRRLFRHHYRGELIRIQTYYCDESFQLTPNHEVLCGRKGETGIHWKPAGEMTKKDYVLLPRLQETHDRDAIHISQIVRGYQVVDGKARRSRLKARVPDTIPLGPEFMRFAGYYLAEGSVGARGHVLQFSFSSREQQFAEDVLRLLHVLFGLTGKKLWINNLCEVRVNSVVLCELMPALFGKTASAKRLPDWMLYLPEEKLAEWLKGFWRGDGNTDRDGFRFHTISEVLAYQVRLVLTRFGLFSSMSCRKKTNIGPSRIGQRMIIARHDCYCIKVGGKSLKRLSEILGTEHPYIQKRWCTYQRGKRSRNYLWLPIRSIERIPYDGEVCNIETEKQSYVLSNMAVHNCTADPGWVTGTSYGIYGPWTLGVSSVVIGGRFDPDRWYETIQRYKVTMWYSAPTAYRMLMSAGEAIPKKYNLNSLRHICSVGEPLNPEALKWIKKITGLAPHETWWMTETGMQLICNYRSKDFPIGATGKPFPGTYATVVDDQGKEAPPGQLGHLVVKPGWPSMMKEIWKNPAKYQEYFRIAGWYVSGDTAYKDEHGYIWYQGRADDVIKTAGERVGPFEVESALVAHPAVAEAGVIGKPDAVRGSIIKAFIALRKGYQPSEPLKKEIADFVKNNLAAHAAPREIDFVEKVPKTRSGKIMRRVLRAWDQGLPVGDISTMEE